jgi:hypothetical protein
MEAVSFVQIPAKQWEPHFQRNSIPHKKSWILISSQLRCMCKHLLTWFINNRKLWLAECDAVSQETSCLQNVIWPLRRLTAYWMWVIVWAHLLCAERDAVSEEACCLLIVIIHKEACHLLSVIHKISKCHIQYRQTWLRNDVVALYTGTRKKEEDKEEIQKNK